MFHSVMFVISNNIDQQFERIMVICTQPAANNGKYYTLPYTYQSIYVIGLNVILLRLLNVIAVNGTLWKLSFGSNIPDFI